MTTVLQASNQVIPSEEIIPLLVSYELLPQLLRGRIIDQAIASIECTLEETASSCQQFYQKHQLTSETDHQAWLACYDMSPKQLESLATRELKIRKFKQVTWGHKLESYFLQRKRQLDKIIYSLMRTKDKGLAQELYFRIQEGEQSFAELAHTYAQGPEAQTGGLVGPIETRHLPQALVKLFQMSQPGQLWPPFRLGEWFVIVRLEKLIPARLDEPMRQQLLNELFEAWLQEQLNQLDLLGLHTPPLTIC